MLDLKKAFDTVDHDILCRKLRAMGVESVEWFRSYLADRTQFGLVQQLFKYPNDVLSWSESKRNILNIQYRSHGSPISLATPRARSWREIKNIPQHTEFA
ncbi:hypothetical protein DPMN_155297 [Dreissena polymorpha]|uniref:Reverse transcriptase domain-containing protein n=1 Tax=Dreissena polymorpha TaxID=45954 RepID=A0A9D4FM01_DREPO|nr:hypothetical protein DPMN_155297 [Dreissena polymorpha]